MLCSLKYYASFFALLLLGKSDSCSADCVKEFGQCVTNRDCCRADEVDTTEQQHGDLECVLGDWSVTTDSTCLSKRSQELEELSKEQNLDHQSLTVLLKHHIYRYPEIREAHSKRLRESKREEDPLFYQKITEKYRHEFARLVVGLERKYGIRDADALPALIREFFEWRETVDIVQVFANGIAETENKDSSKEEF